MNNMHDEMQTLTTWMKSQGVVRFKRFKSGGFEVQFSEQAVLRAITPVPPPAPQKTPEQIKKEMEEEHDRTLFHSSG